LRWGSQSSTAAAERVVNILDFARRHGLPGPRDDTLAVLAAHGPAIAGSLEFFGDHNTSNHLADNGRGLFRLGLELDLKNCADLGGRILVEEAKRIFLASGVLREGSSHYHLLLARQYADCWLAAQNHNRPETEALEAALREALAVIPHLHLPGGFPLIGDISPDCPPEHLYGLIPGGDINLGWTGNLDEADRESLTALRDSVEPVTRDRLAKDGWFRAGFGHGPWSALMHAAPGGWSFMPGHGHQDCGAFELHYQDEVLFCDPGRGSYQEEAEADYFVSARAHNGITIAGQDPYPPNKPYYDEPFRRRVGGPEPVIEETPDGVTLRHAGSSWIGGVEDVSREWTFSDQSLVIGDRIEGRGAKTVTRRLITPLPVKAQGQSITLMGRNHSFRVTPDIGASVSLKPITRWRAYGSGETATVIEIETETRLPWNGSLTIEVTG